MGLAGGLVTFAILWMLCFFTVLPWGMQSHIDAGEEVVPGADPAAPVKPRLALKAAITTAIASVIWSSLYIVIAYRLVSLDDFPF